MKRMIQVYVGEKHAGTLYFEAVGARERSTFMYEESWLRSSGFSLDPALQLVAGPQFHRKSRDGSVFHAAFADTEPDGWARRVILRDNAKRRQEAKRAGLEPDTVRLNSMDFLLAVDDASRVGAIRFKDENGVFCRTSEVGRRTAPPLIELGRLLRATRAIEIEDETAADLAYLLGRGTSVGGMRPKCTVIEEDGQLAIAKFPSVNDERSVTKGEVLALRLAKASGIRAAEARLVESDGIPVALIRRFDRIDGKRIPYMSAATLLGAQPEDAREYYYTEIVDALRIHGADSETDIQELWRRMAFSILITNVDDHLRNHGFLHVDRGQWCLAPAFDLNPFPERVRELKTWISEETGPEATVDALMSVTSYFQISLPRARDILREVECAVSGWREEGRVLGMTDRDLETFEDAFEHAERKAAVRHGAPRSVSM